MPFCPKCKYEYREGIKICPDCDLELKAHLHEDPREREEQKYSDEPLVTLARVYDRLEVDIMKSVLDSAGIPAYIQSDVSPYSREAFVARDRGYSIIVQESRYQDATDALQSAIQEGKHLQAFGN